MFTKKILQKALTRTLAEDGTQGGKHVEAAPVQDSIITMLIHDIFGGEILKTHKRKGWHFYNRIDGERIDLTETVSDRSDFIRKFEDIPATAGETSSYFDKTDYLTFFMKFVRAFEEIVGLNKYGSGFTA
jgi:hypothetical protein